MIDFDKLKAPFPPDEIEFRVGATNSEKSKGMALAYLDARAVMDRLDEVCGPENWQCKYSHANGKTVCDIGIKTEGVLTEAAEGGLRQVTTVEWVWKADGAGDTDFEATKGALSDAFKRAAVRWGIGRYLYDLPAPWVPIQARGKTFVIPPEELGKLRQMLSNGKHETQKDLPKEHWFGPLNKTSLQKQMTGFKAELDDCTDEGMLAGLLDAYKPVLDQCAKEPQMALWWYGDGKDHKGAARAIADKKTELRNLEYATGR